MRGAALACALAAALVLPPATTFAQQGGEFPVPTYAGAYQPQNTDERGLWSVEDEHERKLRDSDAVIRDPALDEYVRSVLCRAVGDQRCEAVRIYIVRVPAFNASMSPNGTMRVYSGLLLRVRSEAELASVLGHEFAHFELRHSLASYRARRTGSDIAAWSLVLGAAALTWGGSTHSNSDLRLSIYGNIMHFERDQERAADTLGFGYMTASGYRPSAAAEVWRAVMNEADQTALDRGRRSQRYDNVAFFASHPTELERADTLSALANRVVAAGDFEGRQRHEAALAPHLAMLLADELARNDFGGTDYIIQRLANEQYSAPLLFARGELYRQRGHPRDLASAADFYQQALALDPGQAEAWRGLGLAQMRSGNTIEGANALRTYLEQTPDVADAPMLRMMIGD